MAVPQLIYVNTLQNQFAFDDEFTIVNNHFIKSWNNFPRLFTRDYFKFSGELSYRPIVTFSYFVDYALWNLNPFGYHLTNNLLHTLNAVLFYYLLAGFFKCRVASFAGALFFSCHPLLTETVNAISYREDLLAATFLVAAFILYHKTYRDKRTFTPAYFASVLCYLCAVFSKEMAITLPVIILLYNGLFITSPNRRYTRPMLHTAGYVLVVVFYLVLRFVFMHNPIESHVSYPGNSMFINFLSMCKVLAFYLKLFFLPAQLCADYVIPYSTTPLDSSFAVSFLALCAIITVVYRSFYHSKPIFFSLLWFFIGILPVLNIIPIENIMAERYLYLPVMGFCMMGGLLFMNRTDGETASFLTTNKALRNSFERHTFAQKNIVRFALLALVLTPFAVRTIQRNMVWLDQKTLWTSTAETSPRSFKAHNNLGNIYRDAGKLDEAIREFQQAITIYPDYCDAHNNLGLAYRKKGMLEEALSEYQEALKLNPQYAYAHNNLGVLYARTNSLDLAIIEFEKAVACKPDYTDAHNNLGASYLQKRHYDRAIQAFLDAIKYNNRSIDAYYNLSVAYLNNKQPDRALDMAKTALSINPNHNDTHKLLKIIYERQRTHNKE